MFDCQIKALCINSGCTTFVISGTFFPDENETTLVQSLYEGYEWYYNETEDLALPNEDLCLGSRIIVSVIEPMTQVNKTLRDFGFYLGLAFQTQDDFLGVWGDAQETGKSAESDLNSGKKTLPILFGLQQGGDFSKSWKNSGSSTKEIPTLVGLLEKEGAKEYTERKTKELTNLALNALDCANPTIEAGEALERLAQTLLKRKE